MTFAKITPNDVTIPSTKPPFREALESIGFVVTYELPGSRQGDIPLVTRFERSSSEHVVTLYEYNYNLWAALLRTGPDVVQELGKHVSLLTAEQAFEKARTGVETTDADLDVGLLAFHAPDQSVPQWLELYLQYLRHDDPYVRVTSCRSVRWVGDLQNPGWPELWEVVQHLKDTDPDKGVRNSAKKALEWKKNPMVQVIP